MWSVVQVFVLCIALTQGLQDLDFDQYTEFERTMISNQRQMIQRLNKLVPTVRSCRDTPAEEPYTFEEADIDDRKGFLPDFEHNMIHYQRTIMSQLNQVAIDADNCGKKDLLHVEGAKEAVVPPPDATPILCNNDQIKFEYKCLSFMTRPMNWEQAEEECRHNGGTLAEPNDTDAFIKVVTEQRQNTYALSRSIWIGTNGLAYTRSPNEPIRAYGINCPTVHFFPGGGDKLSDFPCRYPRSFVCQSPGRTQ